MGKSNIYDIAILGAGTAGMFAALRITDKYPEQRTIMIELGRPPGKRRRALEGFSGCLPTGDGKIYLNDVDYLKQLNIDGRKIPMALKYVNSFLELTHDMKVISNPNVSVSARKKFSTAGFEISLSDYYQWKPENIHKLLRIIAEKLDVNKKLVSSYDNEVFSLRKKEKLFVLTTSEGEILAKKILLCTGRSGWRWATNLYDDLGIITEDDYAEFGIRAELPAKFIKELNGSHCTLKKEDLEIGPFCWQGTVIPEDHSDLVLSAFRSNEARWKTEKVSFPIIGKRLYKDQGSVQADRIGKLSFLLYNDRIIKDKLKLFMKGKCPISIMEEYHWLKNELLNLETLFPSLLKFGSFYVPMIIPRPAKIAINDNLEASEVEGMFVAGENAGVFGIYAAAMMGVVAADSACK